MNAFLDRSLPSPLRIRSPLVQSLVLVGLLGAQSAWAATWNINFTPKQTTGTPSQPVFSWTPPDSATLFGTTVECTDGTITPSSGVYGLEAAPYRRAFVQFSQIYASPSSAAVTVTPDTPGGTANSHDDWSLLGLIADGLSSRSDPPLLIDSAPAPTTASH